MPSGTPPIARIRLARSPVRLFALPALLLVAALGVGLVAVLRPLPLAEVAWYAAMMIAGVLALVGFVLAVRVATVRIDVEEAALRLHWLGGQRRYPLAPGPVTRVRLRGEQAARLRARSRWMGAELGRARLRDEEDIEVVRLASTRTIILVPTERGRLAVAAASEDALIEALSRAAQARQRLEELDETPAATAPEPAAGAQEDDTPAEPEPERHVLTGIERAQLEERLAREREELDAAAASVPASAEFDHGPAPGVEAVPEGEAATEPAHGTAPDGTVTTGRWRRSPGGVPRIGRPRPSAAFVLLPLVGAGIVWGVSTSLGRLPDPGSDLGRLTSLALVMAGPATSVGAIMARAWWPRLVGVVVTSGLAASVFVGRALLGG